MWKFKRKEKLTLRDALEQKQPIEVIRQIVLKDPASVSTRDVAGWTPLHFAVYYDASVKVVQLLIDKCPQALEEKNNLGQLPLHFAAELSKSVEVVQLLIDKCPKALEEKINNGSTPLHIAAEHAKSVEVVQLLIDKCPKALEEQDNYGRTPLHCAAQFSKSVEVVQMLIDKRPDALEETNKNGRTPLHSAAAQNSVEVVRLLVDKCPKALEAKDNDGDTPLHMAAQDAKSVEVVRLLVDKCPQALEEKDDGGRTPLHIAAAFSKSVEVVQQLVDKCPQALEEKTNRGWTPLHMAAQDAKSVEVVQLLVDKCPKALEEKSESGETPLHRAAAFSKSAEVVQLLVDKCPVSLTLVNSSGQRPVDVAQARVLDNDTTKEEISTLLEDAMRRYQQIPEPAVPTPTQPTTMAAPPPVAVDPHKLDRERVRKVVEHTSCEPVAVSSLYVQSILTKSFLGDGFFGTVYKGTDPILGCEFAIKSINTEILRGGSPQDLEAAMKTFRTEQEALSRFRHPNIAALYAYTDPLAEGGVSGGYHLVYELAEKGSLDKFLADDLGRSRLGSFSRRVQIAIDVLTAIRFLHEGSPSVGSCFHRDIKSANIVLKRDFTAQLIDCGLAKFVNDQLKTTGIKGTRGYVCPHYVKTGKYMAACDLYSFGIVLLELWTGRLQNHENHETGESFNFALEYIDEERDVNTDADTAMDLGDTLPAFAERYATVALQCINEKIKKRPSGSAVLNELKDIFVECSSTPGRFSSAASPNDSEPTKAFSTCPTCQTMAILPPHNVCFVCLFRQGVREDFAKLVVSPSSDGLRMEALSKQIGGLSEQIENVSHKIDATLPVMAQLDRRLNNPIPRTFLLLPADLKSGWKNPREWLCSKVQKKCYVYFVCAATQEVVSPPIKLKVAKDWVKKVAPVLATALFLLQVSVKAGLNVNLDLDGAASDLFHVSSTHIAEILREVVSVLDEAPDSRGLLDRLKAQKISDGDVKELCGDAYELVIEKASEQNGWRSQMEPVRAPPSPKVFWVTKAVAQDPKYGYEIVRA